MNSLADWFGCVVGWLLGYGKVTEAHHFFSLIKEIDKIVVGRIWWGGGEGAL
jgi:hypothetical protein